MAVNGLADYPRRYCSICHQVVPRGFRPGPGGRPDASCPQCRSLERHRFLAVLLATLGPVLDDLGTVLEVAPSPETSPLLADLGPQPARPARPRRRQPAGRRTRQPDRAADGGRLR